MTNNKMSQITIKVLKQGTKYPNVIACSFFTMEDAYRSFEKYQRHLKRFLGQVQQLTNFEVRIYTDDTGSEYALKVSEEPNISVLHFDCPEFREGTGHIGTFGTLVRFLPLFEKHEIAWIADIDIPDFFVGQKNLDEMFGHSCDFKISSRICYDRKVYGRKHTIEAGRFISTIQLPKRLLTSFITQLLNGKYEKEVETLNAENTRKPFSRFPYGIDELFLNWPVYDYIKKNDFKVFVETDMLVTNMLTQNIKIPEKDQNVLKSFYYDPIKNKNLVPKMKEIYKKWIPFILEKYPCLQTFLNKLDTFKHDFDEKLYIKSSEL
jgi:hypothetical protein